MSNYLAFLACSMLTMLASGILIGMAVPHECPQPATCWKGLQDDILLGSTSTFNDTQMDTALRLVATHAAREHFYTVNSGYVCADSAIDVWNLLYMQGIKATIAVGRSDEPCKDFTCANHAWVLVRNENHTWIVETTGGEVMRDDDSGYGAGYLNGMEFDTPKEMKEAAP